MVRQAVLQRREFLAGATGAAGFALAGTFISPTEASGTMLTIQEPFHGAVLNHRHGESLQDGLRIQVIGEAPLRDTVTVNGVPARREGNRFLAETVLRERETEIVAVSEGIQGRQEHRIRVVWDRLSKPRYRFSIDDNSFFLRDVAQKQYRSLFDCFYLKILQGLHERYGARFVLNIYYTTEDGFDLPQFPDRYKGEWKENADWIRLAFHAYANDPDRPYQYASERQLIGDLDKVSDQIIRFAGEQTLSPPTVIHWGMIPPPLFKPLYERGVRVLSGYFVRNDRGWDVNYCLDDVRSEYLSRHDALMDFDSGIIFSKIDIVCNSVPVENIVPTLEPLMHDPDTAEVMDIFTHEQYFWPFYVNHIPDHAQRLDTAIRFVTEHGYQPVFYHEGFLGGPV